MIIMMYGNFGLEFVGILSRSYLTLVAVGVEKLIVLRNNNIMAADQSLTYILVRIIIFYDCRAAQCVDTLTLVM
jgi:hypothetical protein